jgi:WhiB family redox-sensing transcriptional regulator
MCVSAARALSVGWASRGACLSGAPDLFFPITSAGPAGPQIAQARAVRAPVPGVYIDCLSYALETGQDAGVWGGTTPTSVGRSSDQHTPHRPALPGGQDEFPA